MFESPRVIIARLAPLLLVVGAMLLAWQLFDSLLFRSGLYYRFVASPDSTAGSTEQALARIRRGYRPGMRNVLVLGDSRTNEGFSAKLANASGGDVNFIGGGIAGTAPRVWYHLLREVDPDGDRFAAVVLVGIFDNTMPREEDLSSRKLDLNYLQPLLRLADARTLPWSFPDPQARELAWRTILLPALAAQPDLRDLASAPIKRLRSLHDNEVAYVDSYINYAGNPGNLSNVTLDPAALAPSPASGNAPNFYKYLERLRESRAGAKPLDSGNQWYFQHWIGGIVALSAAHHRPVYLFTLPRGPFHQAFAGKPQPDLAAVGLKPGDGVELLAPAEISALERPEFYFDGLHLNAVGRQRFTPLLAAAVRSALGPENAPGDAR